MSLLIENIKYNGYTWDLSVTPNDACSVFLTNNPGGVAKSRRMRRMLATS
jgi:hypothetical protein